MNSRGSVEEGEGQGGYSRGGRRGGGDMNSRGWWRRGRGRGRGEQQGGQAGRGGGMISRGWWSRGGRRHMEVWALGSSCVDTL
jgi:hypothetical protein